MKKRNRVLAIAGDIGGYNAIAPVLTALCDLGWHVNLVLFATCTKLFEEKKLVADCRIKKLLAHHTSPVDIARDGQCLRQVAAIRHDMVLAAASQSEEGYGPAASIITLSGKPLVVVEDLYGSSIPILRAICNPSGPSQVVVCTTDRPSQKHLEVHAGVGWKFNIEVTGGPHLPVTQDKPGIWACERNRLRQGLRIFDDEFTIMAVGGTDCSGDMLAMTDLALETAGLQWNRSKILFFPHPRATEHDQTMVQYVGRSMRRLTNCADLGLPVHTVLPAADMVVTLFSTIARHAIIAGMPVGYVDVQPARDYIFREKGLRMPLEAAFVAAWRWDNHRLFAESIKMVRDQPKVAQERYKNARTLFTEYADGKATERIVDVIKGVLVFGPSNPVPRRSKRKSVR